MSALYELVVNQQWEVTSIHIHALADQDAVHQLFFQSQGGATAIIWANYSSASLELFQLMIMKA